MSPQKVETDNRPTQPREKSVSVEVKPEDVARFRAVLAPNGRALDDDDTDAFDEVALEEREMPSARTAVARRDPWLMPPRDIPVVQTVIPKKRVELGTHLARQSAMQPLADLLALVRQRAAGQAVTDLKIVPPEPNPLRLTLHLAMDGDEFVVKARTALGADRREEVQQALHVLEAGLAARLRMPARVVLLA